MDAKERRSAREPKPQSCDRGHSTVVLFVLFGDWQGQWGGVMTQKIKIDRYDFVLALAVAAFVVVAISLVLT